MKPSPRRHGTLIFLLASGRLSLPRADGESPLVKPPGPWWKCLPRVGGRALRLRRRKGISLVEEFTGSQVAHGAEHAAEKFPMATRSVVRRLVAALVAVLVISARALFVGRSVPAGAQ